MRASRNGALVRTDDEELDHVSGASPLLPLMIAVRTCPDRGRGERTTIHPTGTEPVAMADGLRACRSVTMLAAP